MESVREILQGTKMDVILQLNHDLEELRDIIHTLLRLVGERGFCPRCGERVVHLRAMRSPQVVTCNPDGTEHRLSCIHQFPVEAGHAENRE